MPPVPHRASTHCCTALWFPEESHSLTSRWRVWANWGSAWRFSRLFLQVKLPRELGQDFWRDTWQSHVQVTPSQRLLACLLAQVRCFQLVSGCHFSSLPVPTAPTLTCTLCSYFLGILCLHRTLMSQWQLWKLFHFGVLSFLFCCCSLW